MDERVGEKVRRTDNKNTDKGKREEKDRTIQRTWGPGGGSIKDQNTEKRETARIRESEERCKGSRV